MLYGLPYIEDMSRVWGELSSTLSMVGEHTLILGDINQVEYYSQKLVGKAYIHGYQEFVSWRNNWDLVDIPYHGPRFTWCNNREEPHRIYERLDRGYATAQWFKPSRKPPF